ncbi:SWI/SNF-related matrix-associated actin-dependent regulator of chromatin subfamily A-like protein, partial [Melia azedarach]
IIEIEYYTLINFMFSLHSITEENMSHRKIHSQGSVPFSWEDKPGVSRLPAQECPLEKGLQPLNLESPVQPPRPGASCDPAEEILKIPLPPCPSQQPPRRSTSLKGITGWWQEDPFLAAYKECTKKSNPTTSVSSKPNNNKKKKKKKSSKSVFSCKSSCEIRDDDNFVRLSNLPPLPKERIRTIS